MSTSERGRPRLPPRERKRLKSVMLESQQDDFITKMSKKRDVAQGEIIRKLIAIGIESYKSSGKL